MANNAQKFMDCLTDASELLENYPSVGFSDANYNVSQSTQDYFNLALFEEWCEFNEIEVPQKPTIRVIQHQSCTGGTLISKCLAAMPNVALLSEANPLSTLPRSNSHKFAPTDLTYLAKEAGLPLINELSEKLFRTDIELMSKHAKQLGKYLVIREHSHSDFLVGESPSDNSTVRRLLEDNHKVLAVITSRHPVDSYLSLLNNKWVTFTPSSFDEYCKRYLLFIECNSSIPLFKYEDFINDPNIEMKRICETLDLPFNEDFQDVFDLNLLSGDSGRSSSVISKRERREFDDDFNEELKKSANYQKLCKKLCY